MHAKNAAASTVSPDEKLVSIKRRIRLAALLTLGPFVCALGYAAVPAAPAPPARPFSFATVEHLAALRAERPYQVVSTHLPGFLRRLNYAEYHQIRFRPADALWRGRSMFDIAV